MIKAELIERILARNPHFYRHTRRTSSMPSLTRSLRRWRAATALSCAVSGFSLSTAGGHGLDEILGAGPPWQSKRSAIRSSRAAKTFGVD
jgi:hypothetical protein